MNRIYISLRDIPTTRLQLGFEGENDHTQVIFDGTLLYARYPSAVASMTVKSPSGGLYPKTLVQSGNKLAWNITASDCAKAGSGQYQLTFTSGTEVIKTYIGSFSVDSSLLGSGDPPDPVEDWLQEAQEALDAFEQDVSDSEAWAVGTRDGDPVGSTDPAYHNNSKYYAEQAGAIEQTIESTGAEQVAAIEAKGEEVLESIPSDYTELSDGVSDLKSALNNFTFDANYDSTLWGDGGISSKTGQDAPTTTRIRTTSYLSKGVKWIEPKDGYMYALYAYNSGTFVGIYNGAGFVTGSIPFQTTKINLDTLADYDLRVVAAKTDSSKITRAEGINSVVWYSTTDSTLSYPYVPADAKAVGLFKRSTKINPVLQFMCRDGRAVSEVPPDSVYAIKATAENEYDIIRFSVTKTTDGHYVAVHDITINGLARNPDGTAISETVRTAECTLEQLNQYDWGIAYGQQYAGLKVPVLDDCLKYAALYNLRVALDFKWTAFSDAEVDNIVEMLAKYGHYEALIMVAFDNNKSKFFDRNKRLSYNYYGTFANISDKQEYISSLLTGKNRVYLLLSPTSDAPTQEMIRFAIANGFDIMATEISSISQLASFGIGKGLTLIECNNIPNIKEAVNAYAESLT